MEARRVAVTSQAAGICSSKNSLQQQLQQDYNSGSVQSLSLCCWALCSLGDVADMLSQHLQEAAQLTSAASRLWMLADCFILLTTLCHA